MTGRRTLPWSWYVDPEMLRAEHRTVFAGSWHYVGHLGGLADATTFFPTTAGNLPVVVTRDSTGAVRALANVCRHRGAVVCEAPGARDHLRCPYHAWTYALDGTLQNAPRADREEGFGYETHALRPLPLGRWGPFLFVASGEPETTFDEWIGDVRSRVAGLLDVEGLRFLKRTAGAYRANWKVCVENFLECYHCRVAHPGFSKVIATGPDDYRLETSAHGSSQYGPVRQGWTGPFDPTGPVGRGQFHFLFPNTTINIMPGHPNISIGPVIPESPGTTHRYLDYFVAPDVDDGWVTEMLAFDDQVGLEDVALVESVQRGMEAGAHTHGTLFLDSERLIAHFRDYLRSRLD